MAFLKKRKRNGVFKNEAHLESFDPGLSFGHYSPECVKQNNHVRIT